MKTGFIGLGKMGSVMAPRLAEQATQLYGFDPNWHLPDDSRFSLPPQSRHWPIARLSSQWFLMAVLW